MGWKLAVCGEGGSLWSLLDSAAKVCVVTCRGPPNAHLIRPVFPKNSDRKMRNVCQQQASGWWLLHRC